MTAFLDYFLQLMSLAMIIIAPLVVNYRDLPWGYEIPKSWFVQIMMAIMILIYIIRVAISVNKTKLHSLRTKFTRAYFLSKVLPLLILLTALILATIFAIDPRVALVGNEFRYEGLIFSLLLIGWWLVLNRILNKTIINLAVIAFCIIGVIEAIMAISQLIYFLKFNPGVIAQGFYINGSYGQANFFGGKIIITLGFLVLLGFQVLKSHFLKRWMKLLIELIILAAIIACSIALFYSYSYWSWVVSVLAIIAFTYPYLKKFIPAAIVDFLYLVGAIALIILVWFMVRTDFRREIWTAVLDYVKRSPIIGVGLDNQHLAFKLSNAFPTLIVDRGHNLIMDLLLTLGIGGFLAVNYYVYPQIKNLIADLHHQTNAIQRMFAIIVFMSFMRVMMHTSSAVSITDFVMVGAMWWQARQLTIKNEKLNHNTVLSS